MKKILVALFAAAFLAGSGAGIASTETILVAKADVKKKAAKKPAKPAKKKAVKKA